MKTILITVLLMAMSTLVLAQTPTPEMPEYESYKTKGGGQIKRAELMDEQLVRLSSEVIQLKRDVAELKKQMLKLSQK